MKRRRPPDRLPPEGTLRHPDGLPRRRRPHDAAPLGARRAVRAGGRGDDPGRRRAARGPPGGAGGASGTTSGARRGAGRASGGSAPVPEAAVCAGLPAPPSWRSAALALGARAGAHRVRRRARPRYLYQRGCARPLHGHEVERLLALAGPVATRRAARLARPRPARTSAPPTAGCASAACPAGFVALAPGSIWGTKRWPYYTELAATLSARSS